MSCMPAIIRAASRQYREGLSGLLADISHTVHDQGSFLGCNASKWLLVYTNTGTHIPCVYVLQVMLKDIADSKRMNSNIKALPTVVTSPVRGRRQDAASISPLTSTVTSALFWPPHHQDTLKLPSQVKNVMIHHQGLSCTMPHTQLACCCVQTCNLAVHNKAVLGVVIRACSDLTKYRQSLVIKPAQLWPSGRPDSWHSVQLVQRNTWPQGYI